MKILIVEDDALIAMMIEDSVKNLGHDVLGAFPSAAEALAFVKDNRPDLVFMDIELEGPMDGIQCARTLKNNYAVPSLFVTSHDEARDDALDISPLNFLRKPFDEYALETAVLLAERTLKDHKPVNDKNSSRLGNYEFDFEYKTLKSGKEIIKLSQKELRLISILFENLGNTVDTETIKRRVWEDDSTKDNTLAKMISRTNEKLEGINIESHQKIGYFIEEAEV